MLATFYVLTGSFGGVTARAYTERGGTMLGEAIFPTYQEAREWRYTEGM